LQSIDDWSFDVFALDSASEGNALKFVGYELLQKYDLISKFKVRAKLDTFDTGSDAYVALVVLI